METIKRNWFRIVSPIVVIVIFLIVFDFNKEPTTQANLVERNYIGYPLSATGDITCSFPQVMSANYNLDIITYLIPPDEKNPIIFTYSDIGEEFSNLKYIDATQTISETQLVKLSDDTERIVFIEASQYYVALHTIFKTSGISIYSKQVSLFGIPSATTTIGTCIDS